MSTVDRKAAKAAYMREYRLRNIDEYRQKERAWSKAKPSHHPDARRAVHAAKRQALAAQRLDDLRSVLPLIELAEVVYKIAKIQRQREMSKSYYDRNRETRQRVARSRMKQERADHPERVRARDQARYRRDPVGRNATIRNAPSKKPEVRNAKRRESYAADPSIRKASFQRRRAAEKDAEGRFTAAEMRDLRAKQNGVCAYCPADISKRYHVEHRTPLSRGGSNWISNIALSCAHCNLSKGTKTDAEFLRKRRPPG